MKLYVIPFLMLAMSCEAQPQETVKYGTFFAISNNTFGVNDFKVGEVGSYPVCFGAMDFGRNLYRKSSNPVDYSDVIGVIKFEQAGTGYVELMNQDSVILHADFTYSFGKKTRQGMRMTLEFEEVPWTTYSDIEPLAAFNYTQVGPSTWKYSEYMSKYSGNYMWIGNKLQFDSKQGL
jgi:hypothetical protein